MNVFSIVYSNYTGKLFAWPGDRKYQQKYLGNRVVLGVVTARDGESAVAAWKTANL